ncbi:MAG TPA: glycerophosphodiester phosphodiesterase [Acidimicrobiales bacterium]|nr:glycerophosphodiester phosphodiesterase [Acidimicrobiales bacterium]
MVDEVEPWPRRRVQGPVTVLAHRGGAGPWRENTLEAFAGALRLGADGVELDVRRTADGRLVVHHDAEIDGAGEVHALRANELPPWVPGLDEALETCGAAAVNVEVKNAPVEPGFDPAETVATEVVSTLAALSRTPGRGPAHVIVSSFWPATLAAVHRAGPEVATGLLVHPSLDAAEAAERALSIGCVALHPFHAQVTPALVALAHGLGLGVATWTVNERHDVAAVAAAGVDVVISDRVTDALEALGRG